MLIDRMHYEFEVRFDQVNNQTKPDFTPLERDTFLNNAIREFVKKRFGLDPQTKVGFESDSDTIRALSTLHIESPQVQPEITPNDLTDGIYSVDLDDLEEDAWFITKVEVRATKENCPSKKIACRYKPIDQLNDRFSTPSYKWLRCPFRISSSGANSKSTVYIFTEDDFEITSTLISYIKKPNIVFFGGYNQIEGLYTDTDAQVHCDLDENYHDEIVDVAVKLALRSLGDNRINIFQSDIINNKQKTN